MVTGLGSVDAVASEAVKSAASIWMTLSALKVARNMELLELEESPSIVTVESPIDESTDATSEGDSAVPLAVGTYTS